MPNKDATTRIAEYFRNLGKTSPDEEKKKNEEEAEEGSPLGESITASILRKKDKQKG